MTTEQLEARIRENLFHGATTRRLFRLRQQHPELSLEIDQVASALKDAGDDLLRMCRALASDTAA